MVVVISYKSKKIILRIPISIYLTFLLSLIVLFAYFFIFLIIIIFHLLLLFLYLLCVVVVHFSYTAPQRIHIYIVQISLSLLKCIGRCHLMADNNNNLIFLCALLHKIVVTNPVQQILLFVVAIYIILQSFT